MDWYYAQDGRQIGPISESDFPKLVAEGAVTPQTLVWHAGLGDWQPYSSALGIPPVQGSAPGPGSVPPAGDAAQRFCSSCGKSFPVSELALFGESAVCAWCKPAYVQRLRQGMVSTSARTFVYAGFWIRFLAYMIDAILLTVVRYAIFIPLGLSETVRPMHEGFNWAVFGGAEMFSLIAGILYFVFFWTRSGATPGKMVLKLKVVTPEGNPVSLGQAVGRYFAMILSGIILCIGFMMAGWDSEKRSLHDRLADTRVIRSE